MTWSLSPDDDGLEPVLVSPTVPPPRPPPPRPPERTLTGMPPPPSRRPPPPPIQQAQPHQKANGQAAPRQTPTGWQAPVRQALVQNARLEQAPSVIVDPESQVPSAPSNPFVEPLHIEPTLILRGRQVDRLRAQVIEQRRAQRLNHGRRLLVWGALGALAVAMGAIAAFAFSPAGSDERRADARSPGAPLEARGLLPVEGRRQPARDETPPPSQPESATMAATRPESQLRPEKAMAREKAEPSAISPLLESGLEPGAPELPEDSPFEESGLDESEDLSIGQDRDRAPSLPEEPAPVTLEQLMAE